VLEAANKMSFRPNTLAQGLLAGQTGTVGLLTNDLVGRFSLPILMGAEDAFGTGKMSVFLCDARGDSIRESYHVQALLGRRVDGLIVVGTNTNPRPSLGHDLPVPVVYAYGPSVDPRDTSVVPDNVGAGVMATKHLLQTGRSRIAHITGESWFAAAQDRTQGIIQELDSKGLALVGGEAMYGNWSEAWGRAATHALFDRNEDFDAVLCGSDEIARGALDVLRERGVGIPQDVAVMGFDNWAIMVNGARPQLTSIDMDFENLGRRAAQRLFAAIDGDDTPGVEELPCRLVIRGSTALDV
jgi:LacI family transcriptional regulator